MKRENSYRLDSIRKVSVYPDIMLEGKIELVNEAKYVYLVFDIDEVDNSITEETDYWCYRYPFDEMYDSSKHIFDMEPADAIDLMEQIQEAWRKG